jgi:hypothetical protein
MPVVHVGPNARLVSDPEEEVFLLYTSLASLSAADGAAPFRGLGFLDARSDVLTVRLELSAPDASSDTMLRRRKAKKSGKRKKAEPEVVEVELAQDKTALNSRKGDTGSVLWQARYVYTTHYFPQLTTASDQCGLCTARPAAAISLPTRALPLRF